MIDVWDILSEILINYGLEKSYPYAKVPGQFHISTNDEGDKDNISIWGKNGTSSDIYYIGHNKIEISSTKNRKEIINLCDDDCITKIKLFLDKVSTMSRGWDTSLRRYERALWRK